MINSQQNGLEGSLVEILYGKNATEEQIDEVRNLMDENFSHYTVGDDASNKDNWYWNGEVTEENMGKQISGLFGNTGNKTTGSHLHYSVYTKDNIAYSDTTMKILFGKNYQVGSMYNGSW